MAIVMSPREFLSRGPVESSRSPIAAVSNGSTSRTIPAIPPNACTQPVNQLGIDEHRFFAMGSTVLHPFDAMQLGERTQRIGATVTVA
jgi:hypothetical protein